MVELQLYYSEKRGSLKDKTESQIALGTDVVNILTQDI